MAQRILSRSLRLTCLWLATACGATFAQTVLNIAAFPAVDEIAKAAIPAFKKKHPDVEVKITSRAYPDHHTAMTTALSTSSNLPDVMVVEYGYVGRFAEGGGLDHGGAASRPGGFAPCGAAAGDACGRGIPLGWQPSHCGL